MRLLSACNHAVTQQMDLTGASDESPTQSKLCGGLAISVLLVPVKGLAIISRDPEKITRWSPTTFERGLPLVVLTKKPFVRFFGSVTNLASSVNDGLFDNRNDYSIGSPQFLPLITCP